MRSMIISHVPTVVEEVNKQILTTHTNKLAAVLCVTPQMRRLKRKHIWGSTDELINFPHKRNPTLEGYV